MKTRLIDRARSWQCIMPPEGDAVAQRLLKDVDLGFDRGLYPSFLPLDTMFGCAKGKEHLLARHTGGDFVTIALH